MQIEIKEIEVAKLNLQPGDVLAITVKNDDVSQDDLVGLREMLLKLFPNNKVALFAVGLDNEIRFSIIKDSEKLACNTENYCADCNCGKKEAASKEDK